MARREDLVLDALTGRIAAALPAFDVGRSDDLDAELGPLEAVIRRGDPGEPEVSLSPVSYTYAHAVRLEIAVSGKTKAERETAMSAALTAVDTAIGADRSLGGLVEWLEPGSDITLDSVRQAGAPEILLGEVDLIAVYSIPSPLA
jgi:hypothetical protein